MSREMRGALDLIGYARLANTHRPTDPEALAREVRRLRHSGLTARDISVALRLNLDQVINTLQEPA